MQNNYLKNNELPIFIIPNYDNNIVYVPPGHTFIVDCENQTIKDILSIKKTYNSALLENSLLFQIYLKALESERKFHNYINSKFLPVCLTIYISNNCNLSCTYCFSKKNRSNRININAESKMLQQAAELVAKNCVEKNTHFSLVFHGGGEPTIYWYQLQKIFYTIKSITENYNLQLFSYIATNGNISKKKALWLANNMTQIGVSCDGSPEIQNMQRPSKKLPESSNGIEKTIKIFAEHNVRYNIRTTITKNTLNRQVEIVDYLINVLNVKNIRFEPEYGNLTEPFTVEEANLFVSNYLKAEKVAVSKGTILSYSGVRLNEIHGTYCDIFRNTLRLASNSESFNCFYDLEDKNKLMTGFFDFTANKFYISNIQKIKQKVDLIYEKCAKCINIFHCSRNCPDFCIFTAASFETNSFRCKINEDLAVAWIKKAQEKSGAQNSEHLYYE